MSVHRRSTAVGRSALVRTLAALVVLPTTLVACGGDDVQRVSPYDVTPVPAVPDRTAEPVEGVLPDGQYWTTGLRTGDDDSTLAATLVRAYFGPACTAELGAPRSRRVRVPRATGTARGRRSRPVP